jgi:hypothetical protein
MCEDYTLCHMTERKVTTKWMMERIRKANGGPMKNTTADMGREQAEQIEKTAIDIINRHTSDMLGLYLPMHGYSRTSLMLAGILSDGCQNTADCQ